MLESTGERYLPWFEDTLINYEHLHRYAYAAQYVKNKKVLDLASGEGYGSYMLSKVADSVVGIDIDVLAVRHAGLKYERNNLAFKVGSIADVPVEGDNIFDIITCYEAIEHIENYEDCLREVKRLLVPEGVFIVSTPDKAIYTEEAEFKNYYHIHEFYFEEFKALLEKYFNNIIFLGQRVFTGSSIWPLSFQGEAMYREYVVGRSSGEYCFLDQEKKVPRYFIAVVSDKEIDIDLKASTLVDVTRAVDSPVDQLLRRIEKKDKEIHDLRDELRKIYDTKDRGFWMSLRRLKSKLL